MADTRNVTLGLTGWASVSMTTTIWAVWRETLWKGSGTALKPAALPAADACWWWWCGSKRGVPTLEKALDGECWGVEDEDDVEDVDFG